MFYNVKSTTDSIRTPAHILQWVRTTFGDYFDPCPYNPQFDKTKHADGRTIEWKAVTFCNPPYSIGYQFLKKCYIEFEKGHTIVLLCKLGLLARKVFQRKCDVVLFRKRLIFPPHKKPPRFMCMMLIFHKQYQNKLYFYEDLLLHNHFKPSLIRFLIS